MASILPLLSCWRLSGDHLPESLMPEQKDTGFSLPGAQALADFSNLLGDDSLLSEEANPGKADSSSIPFQPPAHIPDEVTGSAALSCEIDFGMLRGDHAVLTMDHIIGRGCVMLGEIQIAAFDSTLASYRTINEAFSLTAAPCMLAIDLTDALHGGRRETLSIRFDETRPAAVSGPVMLRIASGGFLSQMTITPDAVHQTMTLRTQITALSAGRYTLRVQPISPEGFGEAFRESAYRCGYGASFDCEMGFSFPLKRFIPGKPCEAGFVKVTLLVQKDDAAPMFLCDSVILRCGYPGKAPRYALPLTPEICMSDPDALISRLRALHVPAVRLPIPAPDALLRCLGKAGIAACMPDNLPLKSRMLRHPCAAFAAERVGEYAAVPLEASAWQMGSMVSTPRAIDPQLSRCDLLSEVVGRSVDPEDESIQSVLVWLRAALLRMRAEAARQGRYAGALCAPGEWDIPDIADSLRTAFSPLHVSALPLCGAWWSASRFSAVIHAFVPADLYSADDPLIACAVLEDENGLEIAAMRAPCRHTGGHIGILEAQLPDRACVLTLTTRMILDDRILEESSIPVYVGERGPLEAAFQ